MNVIKNFTFQSLKRNKKRTAVTIIGVIISTAMLTAVTVFFSSFLSMMKRDAIATDGNWHASIGSMTLQEAKTVADSDAVDSTVLIRNLGFAKLDGSINETKPYLFVRQYSQNGFEQLSIRLTQGRLPQNSDEVVISETIENSAGVTFEIGDTLDVTLGKRHTPNGETLSNNASLNYEYNEDGTERTLSDYVVPETQHRFTIVGIMERPSFESSFAAGCGVLGLLDISALSASDTVGAAFTFKHIDKGLFDHAIALAEQIGKTKDDIVFNNDLLRYDGIVSYDNVMAFLQIFAGVIIVIIILASVSLIYNSFAISVSERSKQLGLLASVGATKSQKRASVYFEGLFIGAIGIPLGILAGVGGMAITLTAIQPLMESFYHTASGVTLDIVVPLWAIGAAILLSAVTIFISVYVPARRASRIMPIDAIRLAKDVRLTRRAVKTSPLTRAIFGFEATVALKNLKRSRKKYRATIVSLVISIVLFLTASTYANTTQMFSRATQEGINFDMALYDTQLSDAQRESAYEAVQSLDLVTDATTVTRLQGFISVTDADLTEYTKKFESADDMNGKFMIGITALDDKSFSDYADALGLSKTAFSDTKVPTGILINYAQAYAPESKDGAATKISGDTLNVSAGDILTFHTDEEQNPQTADFTVGAVTDKRPMGTTMQNFCFCTLVMKADVFDAFFRSFDNQELRLRHELYLNTDDDQRLEKQIAVATQKLPDSGFFVYNVKSEARSEQNLSTFLGVFIYGFIILISLICTANIFNTVSTNIALRRREFAMLRSVGMTPGGFNRMVRFESIFYGLKGLLFGLPISVAIAFLLYIAQGDVIQTAFTLPWVSYGVAVLMLLVIVFVTMFYSTSKIKKENIIDALKDENI